MVDLDEMNLAVVVDRVDPYDGPETLYARDENHARDESCRLARAINHRPVAAFVVLGVEVGPQIDSR